MIEPYVFFENFKTFESKFSQELEVLNIGILSKFFCNKNVMLEYYHQFIKPNKPKIVLCGINPGKNGAGKTGIPFFDLHSLHDLLPTICAAPTDDKPESSAKFMYNIVKQFGMQYFFKNFYLTNISCIGFYDIKTNKNINYYELPVRIQIYIFDLFSTEINTINPKIIIPLSVEVEKSLIMDLKHEKKIKAEIGKRLQHPAYKGAKICDYIELLEQYIRIYK